MKEYAEYLRKGYILSKDHCPKCSKLLLRDPKTLLSFCIFCGYKEDYLTILNRVEEYLLGILNKERDINKILNILKAIYLIRKLKK